MGDRARHPRRKDDRRDPRDDDRNRTLVHGGIVWTMAPGAEPAPADLVLRGDRIVAVEPATPAAGRSFAPPPTSPLLAAQATTTIDATGCLVMPGLINAHTHTPMTLTRSTADDAGPPGPGLPPAFPPGRDWRGRLTADDHHVAARLAIAEMIRSGTTTFVDMYHDMDRVAEAVRDTGVRAALGWEIVTFRNDPKEWLPYDERTARRSFDAGARFAADWHGRAGGRITALVAPHETATCHEPWLGRAAKLAGELGLGITIHVAESRWEVEQCRQRYGLTPVETLERAGILEHRVIGAHSLYLEDRDVEILARSRYTAASCLGAYVKLAIDATPVPRLLGAGVNVALGTDSAATNNNLNLWDEIHLNATLHGFLARDPTLMAGDLALRLATVGGARALGLDAELGTLEPGKKADLIVLDLQQPHLLPREGALSGNLAYSANGSEVRDVIVDGRVLMRNRKILSFDEAAVLRDTEAIVRRHRNAVGLPNRLVRP